MSSPQTTVWDSGSQGEPVGELLRWILKSSELVGGWTNQSEKYATVKMGSSSPSFGVKIKNIWNHHLDLPNGGEFNGDFHDGKPWKINGWNLQITTI